MPGKFVVGKHTIAHGGNRFKPIMMKHAAHSEILVLVRTDEDEHDEIVNALCEFLNDAFDQEQLPSDLAIQHLHWLDVGDHEEAWHPDFDQRAKYIISRVGARFQAKLIDVTTKDIVDVGHGYQNVFHARSACEANLATNRALRAQHE